MSRRLRITYWAEGFVHPNGNNNNSEMGAVAIERSRISFNDDDELQQLLLDDYDRKIVPLYRETLIPDWQEDLANFVFVNFNGDPDTYADISIDNWRLRNPVDLRPEVDFNDNNFHNNGNNNVTVISKNSPISIRSRSPSTFSVTLNNNLKGGKLRKSRKRRSNRRRSLKNRRH